MKLENLKRRLLYQCQYRGTRELDLLFRQFVESEKTGIFIDWDSNQWQLFESFLKEPEPDLAQWLMQKVNVPKQYKVLVDLITISEKKKIYEKIDSLNQFLETADIFTQLLKSNDFKPVVVILRGDLGVGKTTFARRIIQNLCNDPDLLVPSPTFTLMQEYIPLDRSESIWHIDLYRLNSEEECVEIGLLEIMHSAICFIEWPERMGKYLPKTRIEVIIDINNDGRTLRIEDLRCN
jgi:tRNA threonylcarbamoyl adenosine modification protein YjeE